MPVVPLIVAQTEISAGTVNSAMGAAGAGGAIIILLTVAFIAVYKTCLGPEMKASREQRVADQAVSAKIAEGNATTATAIKDAAADLRLTSAGLAGVSDNLRGMMNQVQQIAVDLAKKA